MKIQFRLFARMFMRFGSLCRELWSKFLDEEVKPSQPLDFVSLYREAHWTRQFGQFRMSPEFEIGSRCIKCERYGKCVDHPGEPDFPSDLIA